MTLPEENPPRRLGGHVWPKGWLHADSPALIANPLAQAAIAVLLLSLLFLVFPGLDIWFSGLFYDGKGFPTGDLGAFVALRALGNNLTFFVALGLVLVLVLKLALPEQQSFIPPRDTLFVLGTLIVGPGIVVNLIFKNNWGRPRPTAVDIFGGNHPFVGAWHMSDACASNCSFVSGEASSAIWLITLAVLLPLAWRRPALRILIGLAVLLSLNRVAAGGHFLSDVLLAWAITLAVIAVAWRFLYVTPPAVLTDPVLEAGLTRAGLAIRDFARAGARRIGAMRPAKPPADPPAPPAA
ncbi:MAG: phosphatase PAP2 family protein [Bauldia sp.]